MPAIFPIEISDNMTYTPNPTHRDGSTIKSQWIIEVAEEVDSFRMSFGRNWLDEDGGWGIHLDSGLIDYLGHAGGDVERRLFIAKFISDANNRWHGYPADHQKKGSTDIPPERILLDWSSAAYLSPAKVVRILRGKPCSL